MNHNQFDYESDLIYPLKDFLRRHTGFRTGEFSDVEIPSIFIEIPLPVKEMINNVKVQSNQKGFSSCFCGDVDSNNIKDNKEYTDSKK